MESIIPDLGLVLVEYDNLATQKAEILSNEGTPHSDAFQGVLKALQSIFALGTRTKDYVPWLVGDFSRRLSIKLKRKPTTTDLPLIRFLQKFDDLFDDPLEYMHHESDIIHIATNNSLYEIRIDQATILFSYKLVDYHKLLESAVNCSMNEFFAIIENKKAEGKDFREWANKTEVSILSIVNDINIFFNQYDEKLQNWENVVSDSLMPSNCHEFYETIVFYHLLAAQMCRYWLELNKRLGYCNDELKLEVHRFYKQFLHITPDTGIIDIVPAEDHDKNLAKTKAACNDYGFIINATTTAEREERADTANALTAVLKKQGLISQDVTDSDILDLLSDGTCKKTFRWLGAQSLLANFVNRMMTHRIKGKVYVSIPHGANLWKDVVHKRFVNKDGKPFKYKSLYKNSAKESNRSKRIVDILMTALPSY